ncbi:unnamed protein product [Arabidopsis halleri]
MVFKFKKKKKIKLKQKHDIERKFNPSKKVTLFICQLETLDIN